MHRVIVAALGGLLVAGRVSAFDPLATAEALRKDLPGFVDPLGRVCEPPQGALSLSAAVDLALCRNPTTRATWAAARQQAAALGSAESAWLPSIAASASDTWERGQRVDVTGGLIGATQRTTDAAVNLSWTLYDFGARGGRIASARHLLDAAALNASSTMQRVILAVVQGYYGIVAADADFAAAKVNEAAAERSLEVARAKQGAGVSTLADVLQAETAYDQAVLARVQADGSVKSSRGTLAVALGVAANQPFTLTPQPVPAELPGLTTRIADLLAEAERQRPDLAAARAQSDAARAGVTVARAAGLPTITIGAGRNFVDESGLAPHQNYNTIGVSVSIPIFTGFSTTYGVRHAKAALEAAEADAEQVRLAVSLDVWNAYYSLETAIQQLTATQSLLKAAASNQEVAIGRYEAGVGTIVDVLTAQSAASSARIQRVGAEYGWQVARAQLALALGRLTSAEPLAASSNP